MSFLANELRKQAHPVLAALVVISLVVGYAAGACSAGWWHTP